MSDETSQGSAPRPMMITVPTVKMIICSMLDIIFDMLTLKIISIS